jgi:integrase
MAVCNWAETVRERGRPLLERNPFRGFPVPAEQNVRQPIVTEEEVGKLREAAPAVDPLCPLYFELTYETGHRRVAVGRLRWSDIDFANGTVHWSAEHDKMGFDHTVPVTSTVLDLLRKQQKSAAVIGDAWIFPSPSGATSSATRPVSRDLLRDWWERLEKAAGIARVRGRGWHSLRRRFASDLDHLPMKQLMTLGGWKTAASVVRYQQHTTEELRAGLKTRRRREMHGR